MCKFVCINVWLYLQRSSRSKRQNKIIEIAILALNKPDDHLVDASHTTIIPRHSKCLELKILISSTYLGKVESSSTLSASDHEVRIAYPLNSTSAQGACQLLTKPSLQTGLMELVLTGKRHNFDTFIILLKADRAALRCVVTGSLHRRHEFSNWHLCNFLICYPLISMLVKVVHVARPSSVDMMFTMI